jgi:hypothetical protein
MRDEVFPNVIGEADVALGDLLRGELKTGSLCEGEREGHAVQAKRSGRA